MPGFLDGKAALVTGAGSGIGRATVLAFAREGARVLASDVDVEGGEQTIRLVRSAGGEAMFSRTDVSDGAEVEAMVASAVDAFGRLDCAFNNAGIGGRLAPLVDYSEADWHQVIDVDLKGVFWCLKYELRQMVKQGGGAIVNTSSITGVTGFPPLMPALAAAKHGVEGLTKSVALQHARDGIRVNAVRPGTIRTPALDPAIATDPNFEAQAESVHPMARLGRPEEVAEAVAWLCSDLASFVTGSAIAVDGGFLAQ